MGASTLALVITNNGQNEITFRLQGQVLTTSVRELVGIANPPPTNVEFMKKVARQLFAQLREQYLQEMQRGEIVVEVATVTPLGGGQYRYQGFFTPADEGDRPTE